MPLVRIDHVEGKPQSYVDAISSTVQAALVAEFGVPEDDYFQIISCGKSGAELKGPSTFLGIRHTSELVFIQITCAEGRTVEQKKSLYIRIAETLPKNTDVRPEDIIINLVETKRENWSFGNGLAPFAE